MEFHFRNMSTGKTKNLPLEKVGDNKYLVDTEGGEEVRQDVADELHVEPKMFPMQTGPQIPWALAEEIYRVYVALFDTRQSLERLAERGGFGWAEVEAMAVMYKRKFGKLPEGWRSNV